MNPSRLAMRNDHPSRKSPHLLFDTSKFAIQRWARPPMLVRLLSSERKATQLTGVLVTARISDSAFGTSAAFAVSLVGEPAVRLLTTGGPIIGTFLNEAYEQE